MIKDYLGLIRHGVIKTANAGTFIFQLLPKQVATALSKLSWIDIFSLNSFLFCFGYKSSYLDPHVGDGHGKSIVKSCPSLLYRAAQCWHPGHFLKHTKRRIHSIFNKRKVGPCVHKKFFSLN